MERNEQRMNGCNSIRSIRAHTSLIRKSNIYIHIYTIYLHSICIRNFIYISVSVTVPDCSYC